MAKRLVGWRSQKIERLNPLTGEIIREIIDREAERYSMVFAAAANTLVRDPDVSKKALRLFFYFIANLKMNDSTFRVEQRYLAKQLQMSQSSVSEGLSELCDRGILHRGDYRGSYELDAEYAWRGTPQVRRERFKVLHGEDK